METPETTSLKTQSAWLLLAKVVGFGFSFLLPILVVRFLSRENVGLYRESFLVIMNAATVLPLGFSMSAYYYLSRETERRAAAIFNILTFNFAVGGAACLTLFAFPQILGNIFQSDELTALAPKIGIVIWIWIFSTFLETVAVANREAKTATAFIIAAQLTKTLFMVTAVILFATVEAFLYAAMLQGALQTVILFVYLNSRFPGFWTDFRPAFFAEQMKYAVPFGLIGILWILQTDVHNYFVAHKYSSADFAVYAYGCFQVPLMAMLAESVTSVLIPKMSELQAKGEKTEMIRLTTRAMQKLAFFYFPTYVFLLITAQTFIITLFTKDYLASVPIFLINLTLLPFSIFVSDPIVRSFQELGKYLLVSRLIVLGGLLTALYFGLRSLDMRGMIAVAIAAILIEKVIAETLVVRKLNFGVKDLHLLKNTAKTAVAALLAGAVTYFFYRSAGGYVFNFAEYVVREIAPTAKTGIVSFAGGSFTLLLTALVFAPVYLLGTLYFGIVEAEEKRLFINFFKSLRKVFVSKRIRNPQSQIQN